MAQHEATNNNVSLWFDLTVAQHKATNTNVSLWFYLTGAQTHDLIQHTQVYSYHLQLKAFLFLCAIIYSLNRIHEYTPQNHYMLFGSSLPPVACRRVHVLFTLFLFICI